MKRSFAAATATLAAIGLGAAAWSGCGPAPASDQTSMARAPDRFRGAPPIRAVATTGPVAELVRRVGGDLIAVDALMGPGVDPHLYSPVPSDVRKLAAADVVVYNGLHLEGRMALLFEEMARSRATYAVTAGLESRRDKRLREPPEFAGLFDPHVWHDPRVWRDCADDLGEWLAAFDPPHAETYRRNAAAYGAELIVLDAWCREQLARIPRERRVLITAHDAFGYFGAAYDVEVAALKGVSTEDEKDLEHQEAIIELIVARKIPAVFVESAVAPKTVKALIEPCRARGWEVAIGGSLYADALGAAGSPEGDYAGMIRANVTTIVDALAPSAELKAERSE